MPELDRRILAFIRHHGAGPSSDADFGGLALEVYRHQFERNPHYRRLCESQGKTPAVVRQWRDIPAMPALAFKELLLASFPLKKKKRVFRTSGTSGERRGAHLFDTLRLYDAAIAPWFERHVTRGRRLDLFFLIAPEHEMKDSSLSHMMSVIEAFGSRPRYYVRKGQPHFEALASDLGRQRRPALLLATAFSLKAFLDHLKTAGLGLCLPVGSRLMETGGFKGRTMAVSKKALYRACLERLGIPASDCVSEYGMTELSSQCYAGADGVFRGPAWMRTRVIDPKTANEAKKGQRGLLRHFDLANRGSVMAVQTEDTGRVQGTGFELLGRASGAELRGCSLNYEEFIRKGGS